MDLDGLVNRLLSCVEGSLTRPACVSCATAGQPVIDFCCDCADADPSSPGAQPGSGQLNANVNSLFDVDPQTLQRSFGRVKPCERGTLGAEIQVTLARCHPTLIDGEPPTCPDLQAEAEAHLLDVEEVWNGLACCGETVAILGVEVQQPPQGGCLVIVATVVALVDRTGRHDVGSP